jgi:hypothetical protein
LAAGGARADAARAADAPDSSASAAQAAKVDLTEVRSRAEKMPIDKRIDIDKRIGITVERVNNDAARGGQTKVAARLAAEFETTSDALLAEKREHGFSWGELVIAHTLLASSREKVGLLDLASLRSDGLTWGAIAFGLRFHLEDFEDAIKAAGRVAMGLSKGDGKAAVMGR